jgi:hypothetical protein
VLEILLMLAIAHILVCLIIIRVFSLDRNEALAVLMLGVFIDLDHLFGMAEYVTQDNGAELLSVHHAMASDIEWKSMLHQPVALIIVLPMALLFTYALPLLSWALHLLMDYVQTYYLGVASLPEMALTVTLVGILIMDEVSLCRHITHSPVTIRTFLAWELGRVTKEARNWLPARTKKRPVDSYL